MEPVCITNLHQNGTIEYIWSSGSINKYKYFRKKEKGFYTKKPDSYI